MPEPQGLTPIFFEFSSTLVGPSDPIGAIPSSYLSLFARGTLGSATTEATASSVATPSRLVFPPASAAPVLPALPSADPVAPVLSALPIVDLADSISSVGADPAPLSRGR